MLLNGFSKATALVLFLVLVITHAAFITALQGPQNTGLAVQARGLNNQLLTVYARLRNLPVGDSPAAIRSEVDSIIGQRAAVLEALIQESPAEALALAFSKDLLDSLASAFPDGAKKLEVVGNWEGELEYLNIDERDLVSHRDIKLIHTGAETLEVHFAAAEPDGLQSGVRLRVSGVRVGTQIAAADGKTSTSTDVAPAAMCTPIGEQRGIVLLVTFPDIPAPSITRTNIDDIFFASSGLSVSEYWRENSNGQTWASGDVSGWYTLDKKYSCSDYSSIRAAAIQAADPYVDFTKYNRVFVIFPDDGSCSYSGLGTLGCSSLSSAEGGTTASSAWMLANFFSSRDSGVKLAAHEAGHNLGLHHASSRDYGSEPLGSPNASGTLNEYGDRFSAMGGWNLGHYAAQHKVQLGWLSQTDYQTVTADGAFSLAPAASTGGLRALKIQRSSSSSLWLEYRQPEGNYDSTLFSQIYTGATIHYQDSTTGTHTHLLDFTADTTSWLDPALASGKTWVDPYTKLTISVSGASRSSLSVNVGYGAVGCVEQNPTVSLSPLNPSTYAGQTVNYTLSVTNNDSSGCAARTFELTSLIPEAWPTSFSQSLLSIQPGSSVSASMAKTVPMETAPATYSIDGIAQDSKSTAQAAANLTVAPEPPPLSITVSVPSGTTSAVPITGEVFLGANPVTRASVVFSLVAPDGKITTKKASTDSSGRATWTFRAGPKDPKGTYRVSAEATYKSETAITTDSVTFQIQ